jgi:hypothetical protein
LYAFANDVVLFAESQIGENKKLDLWQETLEFKGFQLSKTKIEYMRYHFSTTTHEGEDVNLEGQVVHKKKYETTTPLSNMLRPPSQATSTQVQPTSSPAQVFDGSIIRSRAKKLQQEVHQRGRTKHIKGESEKSYVRVSLAQQNHPDETVISFDSQKL